MKFSIRLYITVAVVIITMILLSIYKDSLIFLIGMIATIAVNMRFNTDRSSSSTDEGGMSPFDTDNSSHASHNSTGLDISSGSDYSDYSGGE